MAAAAAILELEPSHERAGRIIEDIVQLERRIFPKHESLARSLHDELKRRNSGLVYSTFSAGGDDVVCEGVKESCRRQGHGEALLNAAVERCWRQRVQQVSLHVDPAKTARRRAVPEGRVPGRRHRRGLLLVAEERLPDVHGSVGIKRPPKLILVARELSFALPMAMAVLTEHRHGYCFEI
ncbi:uncharacterized protein LOC133907565 [Phragmites australis]|uniref:uncharacterized protein LOC133907565 n=1 Tax=Phragmites australis TaxID=29695 RepID=UPI002D7984F3|nr:uncharacterized protein LOC133907565 [Phragmites australis]